MKRGTSGAILSIAASNEIGSSRPFIPDHSNRTTSRPLAIGLRKGEGIVALHGFLVRIGRRRRLARAETRFAGVASANYQILLAADFIDRRYTFRGSGKFLRPDRLAGL